jgi:glycosyltransferase involved in cell wall biosynthesis
MVGTEMESPPFISVIVPCRQEAGHIEACVDSILSSDYPSDRLEILVAEGGSTDGTRDLLERLVARHARLRVIDNPVGTAPAALNRGLAEAQGEWIVRMDAHSQYPRDYIPRLMELSQRENAENVGGLFETLPGGTSFVARAIAHALGHPLGVGDARYRTGVTGVTEVDTVPFGCFPRRVFEQVGTFDEELVRNQDDEFNHRIRKAGGRILLTPDVRIRYFARGTLRGLARMYYQYGLFKPLVWRKLGTVPTLRPLIPALFVLGLVSLPMLAWIWPVLWLACGACGGAYALVIIAGALSAWRLGAGPSLAMGLVLPVLHIGYGAGIWVGLIRFGLLRRTVTPTAATRIKISRE